MKLKKARAFWELTKPNINMLVLVSTAFGYYLAARTAGSTWELGPFLLLLLGAGLACGGGGSLNEYGERHIDKKMRRTRGRPLPSGRLTPRETLLFGVALSLTGTAILTLAVHPITGLLAALTLVLYLFVYTPLKKRTTWNTLIGAVPGALPPVGGWVAVSGQISPGAWALFAILFCWQIPHFLAIAKIYQYDYARGGLRMLTTVDPTGRAAARHILFFCIALLVGSLLPTYLGLAGWPYLAGAGLLGSVFMAFGLAAARHPGVFHARRLLLASIIYLPALLALMVIDRAVLTAF